MSEWEGLKDEQFVILRAIRDSWSEYTKQLRRVQPLPEYLEVREIEGAPRSGWECMGNGKFRKSSQQLLSG
jgi:hypothetical protein